MVEVQEHILRQYLKTIEKKLATGDATEHTHRSALEAMVESLASGIIATNEPKHIDALVKESKLPASTVLSSLVQLTIKKLAKELPGKVFVAKKGS